MEGWSSEMLQINANIICKYHATWKGLFHMADTTQILLFVSLFLALIVSPIFILLGFAKLYGLLGFTNSNHNSNSNNNRNKNKKQKLLLQQ